MTDIQLPTPEIAAEAKEAVRVLRQVRAKKSSRVVHVKPEGGKGDVAVTVPRAAYELFLEVLAQMAEGNAVTIVPVHAELTTQQAADLLNVSRPFLIDLLQKGAIPFRTVGTHRRVQAADVLAYKQRDDVERKRILDELAAEAEKHGLGY
jgi:excisionase family DNA binding protein